MKIFIQHFRRFISDQSKIDTFKFASQSWCIIIMDVSILIMIAAAWVFWRTNKDLRNTINRQRIMLACRDAATMKETAPSQMPVNKLIKKKRTRGRRLGKRLRMRQTKMHKYLHQMSKSESPETEGFESEIEQHQSVKEHRWTDELWSCVTIGSDLESHYVPPKAEDALWKAVLWCCVEIAREEKSVIITKKKVDSKIFKEFGVKLKRMHNEPQRKCRIKGFISFDKRRNGVWCIEPEGFQKASELFSVHNVKSHQNV